ncbi:TPA: hypothetical protein SIF56_004482 [Escherichia coli]|nr:hypothetical protein [Escherichia coli]
MKLTENGLDKRIKEVEAWIGQRSKLSDKDYLEYLEEYDRLIELKGRLRTAEGKGERKRIDPNTLITSGMSLLGVMMMLEYEKTDVISTKAMSLVNRLFK